MAPVDISLFASTQLKLLNIELEAERRESALLLASLPPVALARAGQAITNLIIGATRTGLGGKSVVELVPDPAIGKSELGEHVIRTGDIVAIAEQPKGSEQKSEKQDLLKTASEGIVVKVTSTLVSVALDEDRNHDGLENCRVWLVKLANEVTYKRMNWTMKRLQDMQDSERTPLMQVLFGHSTPSFTSRQEHEAPTEWINPSLNDSQKEAILLAMAANDVALIHGPPGTGKTHTLIELILQLLRTSQRILVCGPSNISVDNIVERLSPHKVPMIRLGHPARLLPSVLSNSLEVLTKTSDAAEIVRDIQKEIDAKQASIRKTKSGRERYAIRLDLKNLRKDYRQREQKCVDQLLTQSRVVLSTLHGAGGWNVRHKEFDVVIIDEASQALEAQCWIPLLEAKKVVLAGDHLQLPPTIKSLNSKTTAQHLSNISVAEPDDIKGDNIKLSLETTMFDRILRLHGTKIKRLLTTQYRMHESIMEFPSNMLYEGKLVAAEAVRRRLLVDLPYEVAETDDTKEPVIFCDTQGGDFPEQSEKHTASGKSKAGRGLLGESKSNEAEARLVRRHVSALIDAGVRPEDIAIITPYIAQVTVLSRMLRDRYPTLEIGSVDGFQGREKEAIIVSLVRSGSDVGFLAEKRRLNVSMTRPRRHLCIIGDAATLSKGSNFLKEWMAHLEDHADLRYPDLSDLATA